MKRANASEVTEVHESEAELMQKVEGKASLETLLRCLPAIAHGGSMGEARVVLVRLLTDDKEEAVRQTVILRRLRDAVEALHRQAVEVTAGLH